MDDDRYLRMLDEMERLAKTGYTDVEVAHGDADDLLCEALKMAGLDRLVELYDKVPKWYA